MSTAKSPQDIFSDRTPDRLHIDDVPRLTWRLSSPETSDDETNEQTTGNDQSREECEGSSKCEANNTSSPYKNLCNGLKNYQRTVEEHILDSAITNDIHDKNNTVENDTLMDIEITLSPTLLKESGCPDTWDNIIDEVLAEDRDFNQIPTDIIPQIDNEILTFSTDEENEAEQSSCQINKRREQQQLSAEKTPRDAESNLIPSSSKCNDKLEDILENETEMMGERLSQTLIISPHPSQSELQSESLVDSTQIQKMQNQISPKKTAKYIISQPKARGKNMKKLLSSLNRCKQVKVKSQKNQRKKQPVTISSKNNQKNYDRKYRHCNISLPQNSRSGYMLRTAQHRDPEAIVNVVKVPSRAEKAGVTFARNFGMKNHEKGRKSLQQRVRNRVTNLKEELFLWVSGTCQMTLARMRRILVEAKAAKEVCTTLLFENKSAIKQKELQEIQQMCDWLVSHVSKAIQESSVNNSLLQYSSTSSSQTSFSTVGPSSSEFYSPTSDEVEGLDVSTSKTSHTSDNIISNNSNDQQMKSGKASEMQSTRRAVEQAVHMSSSDEEEIVKFSLQKSHGTQLSFSHDTGSKKLRRIRGRHGTSSSCTTSTSRHHLKNTSTQTSGSEESDHPVEDVEVSNSDIFSRISTSIAVTPKKHVTFEKNQSSDIHTSKSIGTETSDTCAVFDTKQSQDISEILQKIFPERKISLAKIILNTSQENSVSWQPVIVENLCKDDTGRAGDVGHHHLPSSNAEKLIILQEHGSSVSNNETVSVPNILGTRESEIIPTNNSKQTVSTAVSPEDGINRNSVETAVVEFSKTTHPMKSANDGIPAPHNSSVPFSGSCHLQNLQQKSVQILTSAATLCETEQHKDATDSQELPYEEFCQSSETTKKENNTSTKQPKITYNQKYLKNNKTEICDNNYRAMSDKPECPLPSCSHQNQRRDSGFDTQHSSLQMSCGIPNPNNVSTLNTSATQITGTDKCFSQLPQNCESQTQSESISILAEPNATKKHYETTVDSTGVKETEKGPSNIFKIVPSQQSEKPKPPFYEVPPQTIFDIVSLCLPSRGEYIPNDQLPEGFWENPDFPWLPEWIDDLDEWDD